MSRDWGQETRDCFHLPIGVAIVSGHAKLKLRRLHYVRATAAEAVHVCNANHSENRWRPSQNGRSSWYSEHIPEGYATFEQFRNGYGTISGFLEVFQYHSLQLLQLDCVN